jgi:hypothetical protein
MEWGEFTAISWLRASVSSGKRSRASMMRRWGEGSYFNGTVNFGFISATGYGKQF